MRRVIIESPYAGDVEGNRAYLGRAIIHSLSLGESPLASHGLYPHFLNDDDPAERKAGILAGLEWAKAADAVAYYLDRGMSSGMLFALERHVCAGRKIEARLLSGQPHLDFKYRNWRGEEDQRRAIYKGFRWGRTEYHPQYQILMAGVCLDRGEPRDFAVKDMVFLPAVLP